MCEGVSFLTCLPHIDPMLEVEAKNCPLNYGGKTAEAVAHIWLISQAAERIITRNAD